jgi:hypothetical protein
MRDHRHPLTGDADRKVVGPDSRSGDVADSTTVVVTWNEDAPAD